MRIIIFAIMIVAMGCSEIRDSKARQRTLARLVSARASEQQLLQELPLDWVRYEKNSEKGRAFEGSLLRRKSTDLLKVHRIWSASDFALFYSSESTVTIAFVRSNVVFDFYVGAQ
jgi:hypothetical protein